MTQEVQGLGYSGFSPSIANAQAAGHPVTVAAYPDGAEGIQLSVNEVAQKIREGRLDKDVRGWAGDVLIAAGKPRTVKGQVTAIVEAFRQQTVYVPDPTGAEYISSAAATLCLRPGLCVRARDCIPQGTLLLRDDYALVPIEEIKKGDKIWGFDKWTTVRDVWFKGPLKVDAITTNTGATMYLTPGHKLYVGRCKHGEDCQNFDCQRPGARVESFERITVGELEEGDTLLRPERIAFGSTTPDPDRVYVEGLALADGWTERACHAFHISGKDGFRKAKQKQEVKEICDRLGIETRMHRRYITVKDKAWALRIHELGAYARFKHADTLNLGEAAAAALLRGIMADSTANTHGEGRTFSTTSYTLLIQARVLHRMFGVTTGVNLLTPEMHKGAGRHPLWRMQVWAPSERAEKTLAVKRIDRNVMRLPCWDISTEDHYVYLPEHDVTVSNCDDGVVAVGSALMSIGIPVMVVKQSFGPQHQEHVLLEFQDEQGNWYPIDPSTTSTPVGFAADAVEEVRIDPMDQVSKLTGTAGAEIVTLGRPLGLGDACCASCAAGGPCEGATNAAKDGADAVKDGTGQTMTERGGVHHVGPRDGAHVGLEDLMRPRPRRVQHYQGRWWEERYGRLYYYEGGGWREYPVNPCHGGACATANAGVAGDCQDMKSLEELAAHGASAEGVGAGLGDSGGVLPPGDWTLVPDMHAVTGLRYALIFGADPKPSTLPDWLLDGFLLGTGPAGVLAGYLNVGRTPLSASDVQTLLAGDWLIESIAQTSLNPSNQTTAWAVQAIAKHDVALSSTPHLVFTALYRQGSPQAGPQQITPPPPPGSPGAPPNDSGAGVGTLAVVALGAGVAAGVGYALWRRSRRGRR